YPAKKQDDKAVFRSVPQPCSISVVPSHIIGPCRQSLWWRGGPLRRMPPQNTSGERKADVVGGKINPPDTTPLSAPPREEIASLATIPEACRPAAAPSGKRSIYLFDRKSGNLVRRVRGLPNAVQNLAFSETLLRSRLRLDLGDHNAKHDSGRSSLHNPRP